MIKKVVFLISVYLFTIVGCNKDDLTVTTGIIGTVKYGKGDCMPIIDYESRVYSDYDGKIYFVEKDDWDNLGDGDYAQLKNSSINVLTKQGKFSAKLSEGTYLVMPEDFNEYSEENTITIISGKTINRDFKFFRCTSY